MESEHSTDGSDLPSLRVSPGVTAQLVVDDPRFDAVSRLVAGAGGLARLIDHPRIQKSGLALVGHTHGVVPTRVQLLGETEVSFLEQLGADERRKRVDGLFALGLSLVVLSRGVEPLSELVDAARATDTPLVVSSPRSSRTIHILHSILDDLLAPSETRHGVLIDVHGVGMLLLGPSGIGKSECALSLLERGHRLVADDQVALTRLPSDQVVGRAPAVLRNHLELRGIGIINVRDLFGANAVRDLKLVQLVVELCPWMEGEDYDRLGVDEHSYSLLDVHVPMLRIPVRSGRNMAVILEVAARNHILKSAGQHSAKSFIAGLGGELGTTDGEPR